jgi:hypothetical protein
MPGSSNTLLFLIIAYALTMFDIIIPITPGIICHPKESDCMLSPRTPEHRDHVIQFEQDLIKTLR